MPDPNVTVLHARGVLDIDTGEIIESGYVRIEGTRITAVSADKRVAGDADQVIELPELTLIPGMMDMEVDLVLGGPGVMRLLPGGLTSGFAGAIFMGFGSMLAGGCAVGAGMTGGAIFALTAWIALLGMWGGAGLTDRLLDNRPIKGESIARNLPVARAT